MTIVNTDGKIKYIKIAKNVKYRDVKYNDMNEGKIMNKEEIDELFIAYTSYSDREFEKVFSKYAEISGNEYHNTSDIEQGYKTIMSKIEQGDYEYFISKGKSRETINLYLILICNSSKKENIKKMEEDFLKSEKVIEFGIDKEVIKELIKTTENIEEYLTLENITKFNFNSYDITDLIKATGNVQKYLLKGQDEEDIQFNIVNIIKESGKIEECLTHENIKKYGLEVYVTELIKESGKIEEYLTLEKVQEYRNYGLDITELVRATGNIKKYLFKYQIQDENSKFLYLTIANIIKAEGRIEEYLTPEKIKELDLEDYEIGALINELKDVEKYLFEWQDKDDTELQLTIANVIKAEGRIEEYLTPEMIRKFELNNDEITNLIKATKDVEKYLLKWQDKDDTELQLTITNAIKAEGKIEEYLTPEMIRKFDLDEQDITELIRESGNIEKYLFKWQNKEMRNLYLTIANVIKAEGKIEEYLTEENIKKFRLKDLYITDLIKETGNVEKYLFEWQDIEDKGLILNILNILKATSKTKEFEYRPSSSKIKLPSNMTIGIEIESEGEHSEEIRQLRSMKNFGIKGNWQCKGDSSLEDGLEIVSPILRGNELNASEEIKEICHILKICSQNVSERCGRHVHIGADYLTNKNSWMNLLEIWGNVEKIFYIISNKKAEIPRKEVFRYARPISGNIEEELSKGTVQLDSIEDLKAFAKNSQDERYYGINFFNVGKAKNTIEFRLSNGTIDADTWIENINLFGGIIKAAEELSKIQEKSIKECTEEEIKMLHNLEEIKSEDVSQEQKLEALLELIISEEDRDIYRKRYQVNSELIRQNPKMQEGITYKMAKKSITVKSIEKKVFVGNEAVTGQDYSRNEAIMQEISRNDILDLLWYI